MKGYTEYTNSAIDDLCGKPFYKRSDNVIKHCSLDPQEMSKTKNFITLPFQACILILRCLMKHISSEYTRFAICSPFNTITFPATLRILLHTALKQYGHEMMQIESF